VVVELEREAAAAGYERAYLTTGPRQPEAKALYLALGYTALFDVEADPLTIGPLPFVKSLT
jgi:polar amino acid transport system permease protein